MDHNASSRDGTRKSAAMEKHPAVYILTNRPFGTLYIGATSNLRARVWQHREDLVEGFTNAIASTRLV